MPPFRSQRRHWYVNVIGWLPVQVPVLAVRVWFSTAVPEIVGSWVLAGLFGAALITGEAFELKLAVPSLFVAITRERIRWPTSAPVSTYVRLVAPLIVLELTPLTPPPLVSQRSQRY